MDAATLSQKLAALEHALSLRADGPLHDLFLSLQDGVRQLQQENEELALQNVSLRHRIRGGRCSSLPLVSLSQNGAGDYPELDPELDVASLSGAPSPGEDNARLWRVTHFFTF